MTPLKHSAPSSVNEPPSKKAAVSAPAPVAQVPTTWTTHNFQFKSRDTKAIQVEGAIVIPPPSGFPLSQTQILTTLENSAKSLTSVICTKVPDSMCGAFGQVVDAISPKEAPSKALVIKKNIDESQFRAFRNEAQNHSHLNHKNIIPCLGYCTVPGLNKVLILMPRAKESLLSRLKRESEFSWKTCLKISTQIIEGLSYLHTQRLVHQDISPRNILLSEDDNTTICDFGRAQQAGERNPFSITTQRSSYRVFFGHRSKLHLESAYLSLAPELFYGKSATYKSDLFGWGAITLNLLRCDTRWVTWTNDPNCKFQFNCPDECEHFDARHHRQYSDLRSCITGGTALIPELSDQNENNQIDIALLIGLAESCLRINPEERPESADYICIEIKAYLSS